MLGAAPKRDWLVGAVARAIASFGPLRAVLGLLLIVVGLMALPASAKEDNGITIFAQPIYGTLEVFYVNSDGGIRWIYKEKNGAWHQPRDLTGPEVAPLGAAIFPLWSVQNDQLEVFWVDKDGALNFFYKDHNGPYSQVFKLSGPGFAMPGAPLAGLWQPRYHHLEVFGIAPDGALSHVYKTDNKKWNAAGRLYGPGFGVPGSRPFAIYQDTGGQSQVFAVGADGAVNLIWKPYNENWKPPFPITRPGAAPAGASLTGVYMPPYDQLEVLFADRDGAAVTVWKNGTNIYAWRDARISDPGFAVPGSSVSAVFQASNTFLEVFGVGADGAVNDVYKVNNGVWKKYFRIGEPGAGNPGNTVSGGLEPNSTQMEVVWRDGAGVVWDGWKGEGSKAWTRFRLTGPAGLGLLTPGECSRFFNAWRSGRENAYLMTECSEIMGINAYCAKQDAYVAMTYGGPKGNDRWLVCTPNYHPDSVGEQVEKIAKGVSEGLQDAFVAASPYLGPAIEAAGCINGVVYACATLALDIAQRTVGDLPAPVRAAVSLGNEVIACANGDLTSCITAGKRGYETAAGHELPGGNLIQAALDGRACTKDKIFAACVRLGLAAAEVAGVPKGVIPANIGKIFVNTEKCLDSLDTDNHDSCVDLGAEIAAANDMPFGDIVKGAELAEKCANGDEDACFELGKKAANVAGVPVGLATSLAHKSEQCWNGDTVACLDVAAQAMRATGVNDRDVELMRKCAARDPKACTILAATATGGVRFGDALQTAQAVSDCQQSSEPACVALAQQAIDKYAPENIRSNLPPLTSAIKKAKDTLQTAQANNNLEPFLSTKSAPSASVPAVDPLLAMPTAPSPAAGVSFSGQWVSFVRNGVSYRLELSQDASGRVSGRYTQGTIGNGVVVGRDLYAVWTQGKATGTVLFHMAPDSTSFAGMWTQGPPEIKPTADNVRGVWDGYSANVFESGPPATPVSGRYELRRDRFGDVLQLTITGTDVSGSFTAGKLTGTVRQQPGLPAELTVKVSDANGAGDGRFFLYPNGGGFSGFWHTSLSGFNAWSGLLVAADAPPQDTADAGPGSEAPAAEVPPAAPPAAPASPNPPDASVPSGQCPAATARVTQDMSTREGSNGPVIGKARANIEVQCLACDANWCLIASSNPRSTVSRRYLDFSVAVAEPAKPVEPTPVASVPSGQCPAATARVTQDMNTREGSNGPVIGKARANIQVQCLACDASWCLIASSNPRSTVSRRYLDFSVAVAEPTKPAPGKQADPTPAPAAANVDFTGRWTVTSDKGWTYYFRLNQTGSDAVGFYIDQSGATARFKGTVEGNVFSYGWDQDDGFAGGGTFALEGDRLNGTYVTNPDPRLSNSDLRGTWGGERSAGPAADISGPWSVSSSSGVSYNMWFEVDGERVSGTYTSYDQVYTGSISGWITGNVLVYEWTQPPDYSGGGVFVLSNDRIDGPFKSRQHAGLSEADRAGTWGGTRGGGGGKTQAPAPDPIDIIDYGGCAKCGEDQEPEQPK